jgi:regulator of sigma D
MDVHKEKALKADRAANAIGDAMIKTLSDMRSTFTAQFNLDEQLVTLAIAKAAVGIAADATSQATGMGLNENTELEERLQDVIHDAMNELLCDPD